MIFGKLLHLPADTMGMSKAIRLKRYAQSVLSRSTPLKILNLFRVESELRQRATHLKGIPYVLKIESTNICNFRCPVCYEKRKPHNFKGARGYGKMDPTIFSRLIDEIGKYVYRINLYGFGEPFIYDKTLEMVRYASDHNISVGITSNFNTVDEAAMEKIIQSGLEHLVVSIDGIDQASYEKYQVGGDFSKVMTNLRKFKEMKLKMKQRLPYVDWQFLVMKHNVGMRDKAKAIARELGIGIRYSCIGVDIRDESQRKEWLPEDSNLSQYDYTTLTSKGHGNLKTCSWLYRTVFINWDGGVSPCCNYYTGNKTDDFGNLNDNSFLEIWNNPSYVLARKLVGEQKQPTGEDRENNVCARCNKFFINGENS